MFILVFLATLADKIATSKVLHHKGRLLCSTTLGIKMYGTGHRRILINCFIFAL